MGRMYLVMTVLCGKVNQLLKGIMFLSPLDKPLEMGAVRTPGK